MICLMDGAIYQEPQMSISESLLKDKWKKSEHSKHRTTRLPRLQKHWIVNVKGTSQTPQID